MTDARTAPIKFTAATVREVAERVKRITEGRFALEAIGSHADRGTYYTDAHQALTWYGATGARQACAYYTAGALRTARLLEIELDPAEADFLLGVQVAYTRGGSSTQEERRSFDEWEARGAERAERMVGADQ